MPGSEVRADCWMSEYMTPWDVYLHGLTAVLEHKKTPFQEMYLVETGAYGKALVLDGKWQSSVVDEFLFHEPLVHPAMIQHGAPRRVLVLGGGEGATAREALRWRTVEKVAMVDIDREVVEACRRHLPEMHQNAFDDPRLELVIDDALDVLGRNDEKWDVIISDLSDPIEEGPSFRLFTKEFFEEAQRALHEDGCFAVQAGPVAPGEFQLHVRLVRTLMAVYPHVLSYSSHVPTYGAPWGFILASARPLETRPDPETVDRLLAEKTAGGFRMLDGRTLLGLLQTPLHLRQAIEKETTVYTLAQPPRFFGKGSLGEKSG
ncbi:MAG: fused MFS/spermidine synthase [Planctomycetes bacterium]|nr:fused MFS/spermidine synthase [Planctomycetota bacterium]